MKEIEVKTQAKLEEVCKAGNIAIVRRGEFLAYGSSQVTAYGSSQVTAYGSSQVRAYGSGQVTAYDSSQVTAYGSGQVRAYGSSQVTAYGSSQVRAYGSSQVTAGGGSQVRAYDSSQVRAYGSSQVRASKFVAVTKHGNAVKVVGGKVIRIVTPKSALQWCAFHGVKVSRGVATLFKGLNANFKATRRAFDYTPGTTPTAPDWDGGLEECGGGLHFSPTPAHTFEFNPSAVKFVACPVRLKDMRAPKASDSYQNKIKAKGCCAPVWECDINGRKV